MPLTLADIERITSQGYGLAEFTVPSDDGTLRLRNTDDGDCYFLDPSGRCSANAFKPEGCRLYPFIYDESARRVVRDDYCPFTREFEPPSDVEGKVRELVGRIETEARGRLSPRSMKRF
jgi:hypothetical protein